MTSTRLPHRVVLVLNPSKRGADRARRGLIRALAAAGSPPPGVLMTTVAEPGAAQTRAAIEHGADLVVVGGGDGTLREVAGVLAGTGVELGVIPLGTANLFARNVHIPTRLDDALRTVLTADARPVDLGRAHLDGVPHPFLVVAGIGNDASTVLSTRAVAKASLGWLAYLESGVRHMVAPHHAYALTLDGSAPSDVLAWTIIAANCGRLPAGITVVPDARVDDGLLDLLVASPRGLEWASVAFHGFAGTPDRARGLDYSTIRSAVIEPAVPSAAQLDGDTFPAVHRMEITVEPGALRVRY